MNVRWTRRLPIVAVVVAGVVAGAAAGAVAAGSGDSPSAKQAPNTLAQRSAQRAAMMKAAKAADATSATNAHCGQTITASLTLNGDLGCTTATGLTVAGNGIVVNLNGFSVNNFGLGGTGIVVAGNHDTVEKGTVNFWDVGVAITNPSSNLPPVGNTITAMFTEADKQVGFQDSGTTTTISSSSAVFAGSYGLESEPNASGSIYKTNHALNNASIGIILFGSHATLTSNIANGNGSSPDSNALVGYGIYDVGDNDKLVTNTTNHNWGMGINAASPTNSDGGGNKAVGNGWATTEPGYTATNPFGENLEQCIGVVCS